MMHPHISIRSRLLSGAGLVAAAVALVVMPSEATAQAVDQYARGLAAKALTTATAAVSGTVSNLNVASFAGATVDAQITACIAALPSAGGTCDAREIPSGGTINSFTVTKSGVTLLGPCGTFTVKGSMIFTATNADKWLGCGMLATGTGGTLFIWGGNATDPMLRLEGVREFETGGYLLRANTTTPAATGIQHETHTGSTSTNNYFHDIYIDGVNGGIGKGLRVCAGNDCGGAGTDGNNDVGLVRRVYVVSYAVAAFSLENTQAKGWLFEDDGCGTNNFGGSYCITTALGPGNTGGAFTAINMVGGRNNVADFYLGATDDTINIYGGVLEHSARLLQTVGSSSAGWPINIIGTRWSADQLNADNHVVLYTQKGGIQIIGVSVDSPLLGSAPNFFLQPSAFSAVGSAMGNNVIWPSGTVTAASNPFQATTTDAKGMSWRLSGNYISDGGSNFFAVPDRLGGTMNAASIGLLSDPGPSGGNTIAYSGTCASTTRKGGIMAGSFVANGACAGGTYILTTSLANISNGLSCTATDLTTPTDLITETAYTTTSVTFTGTAAGSDLIAYRCAGF